MNIGNLDDVLKDKKAIKMLWLEILFNDNIEWENYLEVKEFREAYEKACVWYYNFRTLIEGHIHRKPLKRIKGQIDNKEYRKFIEALNFVSA